MGLSVFEAFHFALQNGPVYTCKIFAAVLTPGQCPVSRSYRHSPSDALPSPGYYHLPLSLHHQSGLLFGETGRGTMAQSGLDQGSRALECYGVRKLLTQLWEWLAV